MPGLYDPGAEFGKQRSTAGHRWMVYDVSFATGRIRWARELASRAPPELKHVKNGPEFAVVGTNDLDEMALATPAIARGSLILRTRSRLYRITNDAR